MLQTLNEEQAAEYADKLHREIITAESFRRQMLYKVASHLEELRDSHLYQSLLGDKTAKFSAYLSQIEIYYSRAKVHALLRIFTRLTSVLGLESESYSDIPQSRLIDILPIVTKENYEDWFSKARTLLSRDWKIEVRQAKGKITEEDEHEHDYEKYEICSVCGQKHKV